MKAVLITRIQSQKGLKDPNLMNLIHEAFISGIKDIYIVSNFSKKNYKINSISVNILQNEKPTSPISINTVLEEIKMTAKIPDAFIVASKEVALIKAGIIQLIEEIKRDKNLLVVGYKFKTKDKDLNNILQQSYENKNLIAFSVPWNTCAVWNYQLFDKYVSKFDEITEVNTFSPIKIGLHNKIPHKGMEDGLAIAKAVSNKKIEVHFKLISEFLLWKIQNNQKQNEKLARKEKVLTDFIKLRNYSLEKLKGAAM